MELLFSVTTKDLELETFPASGAGGQHRDHGNTAVRFTHKPSGAVGEGRDSRSQLQNKKAALKRLSESPKFKAWVKREVAIRSGIPTPEQQVKKMMSPANIQVEYRVDGKWEKAD
jgi:protein subunit release factor B